jgi:hypothetical protein
MIRKIYIILLIILCGCNTSSDSTDRYIWLQKKLHRADISTKRYSLILFVSEKMCSECINKEYININQSIFSKPIIIVGVFEKKRYFQSCVNVISKKYDILYINNQEYRLRKLPEQPFYCIFDNQTQTVTNIFWPNPSEPEKTLQYLQEVDSEYKN